MAKTYKKRKRSTTKRRKRKQKQKPIYMIGCSKGGGNYWGSSPSQWPGVQGPANYLKPYDLSKDPQHMMQLGGGFLPQDLLNLGRDFTFNMSSTYNALNGHNAPVNPAPYRDQLPSSSKILL